MRKLFAHDLLPERPSILPADCYDSELMPVRDRHIVVCAGGVVIDWRCLRTNWNGLGQENLSTEDHSSGMSLPRDRNLPADAFAFAPTGSQTLIRIPPRRLRS